MGRWMDFILGYVAAQLFLGGLFVLDAFGLAGLVARSDTPLLPVALLSVFLGLTTGVSAYATAFALEPVRPRRKHSK